MSDGYGTCKWTCGECGETYEASGVVADFKVESWRGKHKEQHRVEKMTDEERHEHYKFEALVMAEVNRMEREYREAASRQHS